MMTGDTKTDAEDNTTQEPEVSVQTTDLDNESNSQLLKQLFEKVENLESEVETLKDENKELRTSFERRISVLESRADHLVDAIESKEIQINQAKDAASQERGDLSDRINALEAELGIEDWEDGMVKQPSCELERIAQMPEEMRDDELSKSVNRAVMLWNYFEQWSKPVTNGQLLPSSEIRKLLSTRLDTKLEWVQVYRVMDSFNKNTPDDYEIVETKNSGKSIIRYYED